MESIKETLKKLNKARSWFQKATGVSTDMARQIGIKDAELIELYEKELMKELKVK